MWCCITLSMNAPFSIDLSSIRKLLLCECFFSLTTSVNVDSGCECLSSFGLLPLPLPLPFSRLRGMDGMGSFLLSFVWWCVCVTASSLLAGPKDQSTTVVSFIWCGLVVGGLVSNYSFLGVLFCCRCSCSRRRTREVGTMLYHVRTHCPSLLLLFSPFTHSSPSLSLYVTVNQSPIKNVFSQIAMNSLCGSLSPTHPPTHPHTHP